MILDYFRTFPNWLVISPGIAIYVFLDLNRDPVNLLSVYFTFLFIPLLSVLGKWVLKYGWMDGCSCIGSISGFSEHFTKGFPTLILPRGKNVLLSFYSLQCIHCTTEYIILMNVSLCALCYCISAGEADHASHWN